MQKKKVAREINGRIPVFETNIHFDLKQHLNGIDSQHKVFLVVSKNDSCMSKFGFFPHKEGSLFCQNLNILIFEQDLHTLQENEENYFSSWF